jgi:hypothetical protein
MAALLQALDDLVLVLREHSPEAVGALHGSRDIGRNGGSGRRVVLEDVARHQQVVAHAELLGDLVADLIIPIERLPLYPERHGWAEGIFVEPGGAGNVLVAARRREC